MDPKIDGNGDDGDLLDVLFPDQPTPELSTPLILQNDLINFPFPEGTFSIPSGYGDYGAFHFSVQGNTPSFPSVSSGSVPQLGTASSFNNRSFHFGKSEVPAESPTSNINQDVKRTRIEKKRGYDKTYRNKKKEEEEKMKGDLSRFEAENKRLTSQNEDFKCENDKLDEDLQSANVETKRLKTEICKLMSTNIVQETLVETFSQKVIDNDPEEEVAGLKREFAVMKGQTIWENWMSEKEEVLKKVASLEYQNKILKVQVNTLCLRISNPTEIDSEKV